ncbi:hypothetical protein AMTRI_Chr07g74580 [Amborella trichopoda]|uniref:Protein kinase domain-containing protein n=1 Tax=Amborella trichopoda TaxID=13333 RepID=U5D6G9_AMBTC|nr:putative serine/threonine-protein kinase [Amborella trichopoda]XP_020529300.1 putative serine/threonine-protein kinase [Amborella trichopoda]ERN15963.1 hypothetical protein AMTR_s00175p00044500 [Amborella trichopoda]|eukprot:XP_006854496.1 putative serine/threonine-protein kinase [Amborella trichopoda]
MNCLPFLCTRRCPSASEPIPDSPSFRKFHVYSYNDLKIATEDFGESNKIGQGGFGSIYKGKLKNGATVAVKVLSAQSTQGEREFLNEISAIFDIKHQNLVELYGCCVDGDTRILVYGYLENNSLAQVFLGRESSGIEFDWMRRRTIGLGVASGLAYLHEEVKPHIVHRDIKASNILLDKDLNPKISDFGLAKLFPDDKTHISTRVAGTLGYLAPEYAISGQLTRKADVYSFGVLLLEIVSGGSILYSGVQIEEQYLLKRAWELHKAGELLELIDPKLNGDYPREEAIWFLKVALLCVQEKPNLRPNMSEVVKMLSDTVNDMDVNIRKPGIIPNFMAMKMGRTKKTEVLSQSSGHEGSFFSSSTGVTLGSFSS